jgi:hypothetical protein
VQLSGDHLGDAPLVRSKMVRTDAQLAQVLGSLRSEALPRSRRTDTRLSAGRPVVEHPQSTGDPDRRYGATAQPSSLQMFAIEGSHRTCHCRRT